MHDTTLAVLMAILAILARVAFNTSWYDAPAVRDRLRRLRQQDETETSLCAKLEQLPDAQRMPDADHGWFRELLEVRSSVESIVSKMVKR